jgi:hypothetical protein
MAGEKIIAITSGATYTIPSDFYSLVSIEAIGGGGKATSKGGAGGGGYAKITSLSGIAAGNVYTIGIGLGTNAGAQGTYLSPGTQDTFFNNGSTLYAQGGAASTTTTGSAGGAAANCRPTSGAQNGGYGGNGTASNAGGGGGGAAGPSGAGATGANYVGVAEGGAGGNGDNGAGGPGGAGGNNSAGLPGGAGTSWTLTAGGTVGAGGGGGGAGGAYANGNGGLYGGGCGGGDASAHSGQGLIVLTYVPKVSGAGTSTGTATVTGIGKIRVGVGESTGEATVSGVGYLNTDQFCTNEAIVTGYSFSRWYWEQTIISQFANSPTLLTMIDNFCQSINVYQDLNYFYDTIWNVATAKDYGLDVWGIIVGINRVLQVSGLDGGFLGFEQMGSPDATPFNDGPWYSGQSVTSNYALSDSAYRLLLMSKAASNIWDGSTPGLNKILKLLFPEDGRICYVTDGQDMTMEYVFNWILSPVESAMVSSGALPKPAGVSYTIVQS